MLEMYLRGTFTPTFGPYTVTQKNSIIDQYDSKTGQLFHKIDRHLDGLLYYPH